jgi:hypothetical protein
MGLVGNTASLIVVASGGHLVLETGAAITNNTIPGGSGGGVSVDNGGAFTMHDGEISGNRAYYGGGVVGGGNSTLTMTGGTIRGNAATIGGGVFMDGADFFDEVLTGTFTMSGGTISGNQANDSGGGVYVDAMSAFSKTGSGTIYGSNGGANANTAPNGGAVYISSDPATKRNATAGAGVDLGYPGGVQDNWEQD